MPLHEQKRPDRTLNKWKGPSFEAFSCGPLGNNQNSWDMRTRYIIKALGLLLLGFGQALAQNGDWRSVPSGTDKPLLCISFGDASTGYVGGKDSLLLKTTDGGLSWQPIDLSGVIPSAIESDVISIDFVSENDGFMTLGSYRSPMFNGSLYKTADGGQRWEPVDAGPTVPKRTYFFDTNKGFVVGSAFFAGNVISQITDGEAGQYDYFSNNPSQFNYAIDFYDKDHGVVGGDKGLIIRTENGGQTWDTLRTQESDTIMALAYLDGEVLLGATRRGLLISRDEGRNWDMDVFSLTFHYPYFHDVVRSGRDSFIAVGGSGIVEGEGILLSMDPEGSLAIMPFPQVLHAVAMRDDSIGFAVGEQGLIVTNAGEGPSAIGTITNENDGPMLFPNPSNGRFFSQWSRPHGIQVLDVLGKELFVSNEKRKEHLIDLSSAPEGLYIVMVRYGQGSVLAKKLVHKKE